ncbi:hypothetical protein Tco_0999700 [Tanacetum coccineum]
MAGSDDENPPPPPPPPQTPTQQAPHTVSTIKLPILKKDTNGVIKVLPPKIAEEILARERKARTTLLMALPEDHLSKFHKMTDAKEMCLHEFLRVFEYDVKGSTGSSSSTQNVAFVSSESASSTYGRRLRKQEEPKALVTIDGDGVDWTGHAEDEQKNFTLMAYSNSGSNIEVTSYSKECEESYAKLKKLYDEQREQLAEAVKEKEELKTKLENFQSSSKGLSKLLNSQMSAKDKSGFGSSDVEDSHVYDRFAKVKGMHAVPPLMTGIYMPPKSDFGIDESNFTYGPKQSKTSESTANTSDSVSCDTNSSVETLKSVPKPAVNESKAVSKPKVWFDAPIIEEYES